MTMLRKYVEFTDKTAIYPGAGTKHLLALTYLGLGLASEGGEVAGKIKKLMRDEDTKAARAKVIEEMGDCFWYLARLCQELDVDIYEVILANKLKLEDRLRRGVLKGNGDRR